jgi:hypothetical protein
MAEDMQLTDNMSFGFEEWRGSGGDQPSHLP